MSGGNIQNVQGNIGESMAMAHLMEQGYIVFVQFGTASPIDLVAMKNDKLFRVSVKSTRNLTKSGKWLVRLDTTYRTKQENSESGMHYNRKRFDKDAQDILAVYIAPENRVVLIVPSEVTNKNSFFIKAL